MLKTVRNSKFFVRNGLPLRLNRNQAGDYKNSEKSMHGLLRLGSIGVRINIKNKDLHTLFVINRPNAPCCEMNHLIKIQIYFSDF